VRIDVESPPIQFAQQFAREAELSRPKYEIQVAIWSQADFRIKPCHRPAFYQQRIDAFITQQPKDLIDLLEVKRSLERMTSIGLSQLFSRRRVRRARVSNPPPGESASRAREKSGRSLSQFTFG
jgi:hypothetical protein